MAIKERRLKTPQDIRRMLAEVVNDLREREDLDPVKKANAITYVSNTMLKAIEQGEALEILERIERELKK